MTQEKIKTIVIPEKCDDCYFGNIDNYQCELFGKILPYFEKCPECEAQTKVEVKYENERQTP